MDYDAMFKDMPYEDLVDVMNCLMRLVELGMKFDEELLIVEKELEDRDMDEIEESLTLENLKWEIKKYLESEKDSTIKKTEHTLLLQRFLDV